MTTKRLTLREQLANHREAIKRLCDGRVGFAADMTCPNCGHYEMSGCMAPTDSPDHVGAFLGVVMCRACGHVNVGPKP